ncbi:hypothetical protein LINPERPRIM_LOCUS1217 [Linum perenne]
MSSSETLTSRALLISFLST